MECNTDQKKKRMYQLRLWALFGGDILLFALGCVLLATGVVPMFIRTVMVLILIVLVIGLFPTGLMLMTGLGASGTQRVFLTDDTVLYLNWDADKGAGGVKYHFYKVWKVTDLEVKRTSIDVKAFVWYAEAFLERDALPVVNGELGDISEYMENAQRGQRTFSITRTLMREDEILERLNARKKAAAAV